MQGPWTKGRDGNIFVVIIIIIIRIIIFICCNGVAVVVRAQIDLLLWPPGIFPLPRCNIECLEADTTIQICKAAFTLHNSQVEKTYLVSMGCKILKFKTGSKKVLPADSARADSLTFDTGDLWIFS